MKNRNKSILPCVIYKGKTIHVINVVQEGTSLAKITQRQVPVGTDRNHHRYWIFCDVTPGVFVEKGKA